MLYEKAHGSLGCPRSAACARDPQRLRLVDMAGKKAFTFDLGFGCPSQQETIYNNCVRHIIDGRFEGYNAVVLTYGENWIRENLALRCPSQQETIYNNCVRHILDGRFEGYNAVVLTYGENGSEKTCTQVPLSAGDNLQQLCPPYS
ncbi:hypothetical protein MRX96_005330 [Rhipicephalus microplus]